MRDKNEKRENQKLRSDKGIIERDDYYENRKVKFEDTICYEIEDCLHAMKEAGDTPGKRDMENFVDSILSDSYEAYPVECSLSYISPRLLKRFTVVYDINSCEIKEVSAKNIMREEIKDEDIKKYFRPGYSF